MAALAPPAPPTYAVRIDSYALDGSLRLMKTQYADGSAITDLPPMAHALDATTAAVHVRAAYPHVAPMPAGRGFSSGYRDAFRAAQEGESMAIVAHVMDSGIPPWKAHRASSRERSGAGAAAGSGTALGAGNSAAAAPAASGASLADPLAAPAGSPATGRWYDSSDVATFRAHYDAVGAVRAAERVAELDAQLGAASSSSSPRSGNGAGTMPDRRACNSNDEGVPAPREAAPLQGLPGRVVASLHARRAQEVASGSEAAAHDAWARQDRGGASLAATGAHDPRFKSHYSPATNALLEALGAFRYGLQEVAAARLARNALLNRDPADVSHLEWGASLPPGHASVYA